MIDSLYRMPFFEVVVSGRLDDEGEDMITDAKMCVLGELPRDSLRYPAQPAGR